MKTSLRLLLAVALACLFGPHGLRAATGTAPAVGYLIDEVLAMIDGDWNDKGTEFRLSDWDIDSQYGAITASSDAYMDLAGTAAGPITLRKAFIPQSSGNVSLEFCFEMLTKADGYSFVVEAYPGYSAVKFVTTGGNLAYLDNTGTPQTLVANYAAGQRYVVHADLSLTGTSPSAAISINGVVKATGVPFSHAGNYSIADFAILTAPGTATLRMFYVRLTKGYLVYERFTNAAVGAVPDGWTAAAAGGVASAQNMGGSTIMDPRSFQLQGTAASSATLSRGFTASAAKLVWEFKFMLPVKTAGFMAKIQNGSSAVVTLATATSGNFDYLDGNGSYHLLWTGYQANVWYTVRVVADPSAQKADLYVNGKLMAPQVPFDANASSMNTVAFSSAQSVHPAWVDDVYVYPFQADPPDYVPAIQPVTSKGFYVGMQAFFPGWRNGQHLGWDWERRFPSHRSFLGAYDEGNKEVMDWQLKWMAEAGINFFMTGWFLPNNGYPIKESMSEYTEGALNNAYFYAKYSPNVKFVIQDESIGTDVTFEQFRDYILPYWEEYYFKDPRYFVIPSASGRKGWPVIGFYTALKWLGSTEPDAMKNSIALLRQRLVDDGFDGAVVLGQLTSSGKANMDNLYAAGIDYCYSYTWKTNDIGAMESMMITQRDKGSALQPVANISQGWSGEALDTPIVGYTSLSDFHDIGNWAINPGGFLSTLGAGPNSKILFYDNWNEYGEGHYICPTALAGFGYLDNIRNVVTSANSVTDQVPTPAQLARMNVLYSRGWNAYVWDFDAFYVSPKMDTEEWVASAEVTSLAQFGGYLTGQLTGPDPRLNSIAGLGIDGAAYQTVRIQMQTPAAGATGRLFYTTTDSAGFSADKGLSFTFTGAAGSMNEYVLNMGSLASWAGHTVTQLRFAPIATGGTSGTVFKIDFIKVAP